MFYLNIESFFKSTDIINLLLTYSFHWLVLQIGRMFLKPQLFLCIQLCYGIIWILISFMSRKIFLGVTIKDHAITITFFELDFVHIYRLLVFIFILKFCLDLKLLGITCLKLLSYILMSKPMLLLRKFWECLSEYSYELKCKYG